MDSQSPNTSASKVIHILMKEVEDSIYIHIHSITDSEKLIYNFYYPLEHTVLHIVSLEQVSGNIIEN